MLVDTAGLLSIRDAVTSADPLVPVEAQPTPHNIINATTISLIMVDIHSHNTMRRANPPAMPFLSAGVNTKLEWIFQPYIQQTQYEPQRTISCTDDSTPIWARSSILGASCAILWVCLIDCLGVRYWVGNAGDGNENPPHGFAMRGLGGCLGYSYLGFLRCQNTSLTAFRNSIVALCQAIERKRAIGSPPSSMMAMTATLVVFHPAAFAAAWVAEMAERTSCPLMAISSRLPPI